MGKLNLQTVVSNKYVYLLLTLLLFLTVDPLLENFKAGSYLLALILTAVLFAAVYVMSHNKRVLIITSALMAPVLVLRWILDFVTFHEVLLLLFDIFAVVFFLYFLIFLAKMILKETAITLDVVLGAVCVYLLIGLTWGIAYRIIFLLLPHAFHVPAFMVVTRERPPDFIYYSFVTLTTLGYGDITPVAVFARTLSWFEAVLGQIYLTVFIARFVGIYISRKNS